mgnify:CR=1 FL=1
MLNDKDGFDLRKLLPHTPLEVLENYEDLLVYCYDKGSPYFMWDSTMPRYKLRKLNQLGLIKSRRTNKGNLYWLTADGLRHARRVIRQRS